MYQHLFHFSNLLLLHKFNSIFTLPPKDIGVGKYSLICILSFLSIQLLKELSQPFHLTYCLWPFLFTTFLNLNFFWFAFLQFFFVKHSNNFFTVKIANNICPRHCNCLAWSRSFLLYLPLKFLLIFFTNIFTDIFRKRKNP